jgi:uncharacterized Zn-finger protein
MANELVLNVKHENDNNEYYIENNGIYYRNDLLIARIVYKCFNCNNIFDTIIESLNHYKHFHQNIHSINNNNNDINENKIETNCKLLTESNSFGNYVNNNRNKVKKTSDLKKVNKIKVKSNNNINKSNAKEVVENKIICEFCENSYKNLNSLMRHKKIHTNPEKCQFPDCYKTFSTKLELKTHEYSHQNSRDFKCIFKSCEKSFKTMNGLNKHKLIHTNPKECNFPNCGKLFATNTCLKVHQSTHSDDFPLKCEWPGCDYRAKQPSGKSLFN